MEDKIQQLEDMMLVIYRLVYLNKDLFVVFTRRISRPATHVAVVMVRVFIFSVDEYRL